MVIKEYGKFLSHADKHLNNNIIKKTVCTCLVDLNVFNKKMCVGVPEKEMINLTNFKSKD